jgi:hypothetical protein
MVIDIEHVLPKSLFPKYMFRMSNLSASCKRCNMNLKKDKIDFLTGAGARRNGRLFRSKLYKLIHPNLDKYNSHLDLKSRQEGSMVMVKYIVVNNSSKGAYTYEYFKLDRLEKNDFDMAQGSQGRPEIESPELQAAFDAIAPY